MSKRELLRRLLRLSGATWIRWHLLLKGLHCFNYHRIGNPTETEFDRGVFSCTQRHFRDHVEVLAGRFKLITAHDLLGEVKNEAEQLRPLGMITFDDAYIDNYSLAYPVLREYGVAATFFVPTAFVGSSAVPWWDEIAWVMRHATVTHLALDATGEPLEVGPHVTDRTIMRALQWVRKQPVDMGQLVGGIRAKCRPAPECPSGGTTPFMNWGQLREMSGAGMCIGSHTHTHRILSTLSPEAQADELKTSKSILERELGTQVHAVAYPVGSSTAYTAKTCAMAQQAGYRLGFSFERRANGLPLRDRFRIGRYAIDGDMNGMRLRSAIAFPRV